MKRSFLVVVLAVLLVLAISVPALAGTAPYTGVALYSGGNATLSGSSKVESPVIAGQPSAATYVNGTLSTSGSASLSKTVLFVKARGDSVPPLAQFMPETLVSWLTFASQAAQPTGTTCPGLSYSGSKGPASPAPITVDGNLTISGSGTYSFDSVYVAGNVTISGTPTLSFASLRVGGQADGEWGNRTSLGPDLRSRRC